MVNLSKNACRLPVAKRWQDFRQHLALSNIYYMYLCHKISCEEQKWNNLQFILNQIDITETTTLLSNFHERNLRQLPKILCLMLGFREVDCFLVLWFRPATIGEFFTPQEVSELLARITVVGKTEVNKVYDPACGSGSLLLKYAKVLGKDNVRQGFSGKRETSQLTICVV